MDTKRFKEDAMTDGKKLEGVRLFINVNADDWKKLENLSSYVGKIADELNEWLSYLEEKFQKLPILPPSFVEIKDGYLSGWKLGVSTRYDAKGKLWIQASYTNRVWLTKSPLRHRYEAVRYIPKLIEVMEADLDRFSEEIKTSIVTVREATEKFN